LKGHYNRMSPVEIVAWARNRSAQCHFGPADLIAKVDGFRQSPRRAIGCQF